MSWQLVAHTMASLEQTLLAQVRTSLHFHVNYDQSWDCRHLVDFRLATHTQQAHMGSLAYIIKSAAKFYQKIDSGVRYVNLPLT